jgi:hypothetical protein
MRIRTKWIFISTVCILFAACKKDTATTNSTSLSGDWTFEGFNAQTSSTDIDNEGGEIFKTVTTSDYTTEANGGSVNISGNTMTGAGITYSANMKVFVSEYDDDVLDDTLTTFLPITIPPTNSVSTFDVIGSDSIHYTSASMFGSGGNGSPASDGAKFSISGDVLTLTSSVTLDKVIDTLGETIMQHETATVIATLKRK